MLSFSIKKSQDIDMTKCRREMMCKYEVNLKAAPSLRSTFIVHLFHEIGMDWE